MRETIFQAGREAAARFLSEMGFLKAFLGWWGGTRADPEGCCGAGRGGCHCPANSSYFWHFEVNPPSVLPSCGPGWRTGTGGVAAKKGMVLASSEGWRHRGVPGGLLLPFSSGSQAWEDSVGAPRLPPTGIGAVWVKAPLLACFGAIRSLSKPLGDKPQPLEAGGFPYLLTPTAGSWKHESLKRALSGNGQGGTGGFAWILLVFRSLVHSLDACVTEWGPRGEREGPWGGREGRG